MSETHKQAIDSFSPDLNTDFVDKTTSQTISGEKNFLNTIVQTLDKNQGEATAYNERMLYVKSKDGKRIGSFGGAIEATGQSRAYIASSFTKEDGTVVYSILDTYTNGTDTWATAPNPPSSDNSNKIATTSWSRSQLVTLDSNQTITGSKTFTQDINGTAMNAYWADLAEMYYSDADYKPGTLVEFGGSAEITLAINEANAVVSTKPAVCMNNQPEPDKLKLPIALGGRVPVRIYGTLNKFDRIALSKEKFGVACKAEQDDKVIGVTLEAKEKESEDLVLCAVKMKF